MGQGSYALTFFFKSQPEATLPAPWLPLVTAAAFPDPIDLTDRSCSVVRILRPPAFTRVFAVRRFTPPRS